ncbi:MAG TPA: hypothetical protein VMU43_08670 [Candidatus Acidoferrum sp.]|nr:hypothetical protein [Candidatus Acidoferrum sp.]
MAGSTLTSESQLAEGTQRMATEEPKKDSARDAIILLVVVLAVAGYCIRYGLQTLTYLEAKTWVRTDPWLNEVPQPLATPAPLPDFSKMKEKPSFVKTSEWEFRVPWKGEPKERHLPTAIEFRFDTGQAIAFYDPDAQADTLGQLKKLNPVNFDKLSNVFQGAIPQTNYELYRDVYSASPTLMSPFMPLEDAMRANVLLLWKISFGVDAQPGIRSFDWQNARGFEFGDPAKGGPVALRVFDNRDHQFRFLFVTSPGTQGTITQDDINFVIQTLQPIPFEER